MQLELEDVKAKLADRPKLLPPNTDELFALADSLNGTPPDDEERRDIINETVDRIVIRNAGGDVAWHEAYPAGLAG